jgi:hypothetical protein
MEEGGYPFTHDKQQGGVDNAIAEVSRHQRLHASPQVEGL